MKLKELLVLILAALVLASAFVGCGSSKDSSSEGSKVETSTDGTEAKLPGEISGEITVLTNRTDIVDSVMKDYAAKFNEKYPKVKVNYEAITNYEDDVKTRMSTQEYGDVLLMPSIEPKEYSTFFEPLGKVSDLKKKYRYIETKGKYEDTVYGIATFGSAQGVVYNTKIFKEAGITDLPKSPEEFINAMKKIKVVFGDEVVPYYTNYACGWALNQWEDHKTSVSGDPDYANKLAHLDNPFSPGSPHYIVYKLMYDLVREGVCEKDPTTSDWEQSKQMLADGKIGAMVLGSWAIGQIQDLAANKADVGYMPFPSNINGKIYAPAGPDYLMAVNKNSKNKEAALAYLYWFIDESGYYDYCQCIPPRNDAPMPITLKAFEDMGVQYVINNPAPEGEDGLTDKIAKQAEIGLYDDPWKKPIIERALNNKPFDDYMNELNKKWKTAKDEVWAEMK